MHRAILLRAADDLASDPMHWTEISQRRTGDVVVLDLRGVLTLSEEDRRLLPAIAAMLERGQRAFLLNLQHLSYIDRDRKSVV